jgi:hypothetical protein
MKTRGTLLRKTTIIAFENAFKLKCPAYKRQDRSDFKRKKKR